MTTGQLSKFCSPLSYARPRQRALLLETSPENPLGAIFSSYISNKHLPFNLLVHNFIFNSERQQAQFVQMIAVPDLEVPPRLIVGKIPKWETFVFFLFFSIYSMLLLTMIALDEDKSIVPL